MESAIWYSHRQEAVGGGEMTHQGFDLAAYNIAKDWLDGHVVSTAAVQCSAAVIPPMMQYETIIWERFENQQGRILHHIFHTDEQTAAKVHGYIVSNLKEVKDGN